MSNIKALEEKTTHRLVTYINDVDFDDFMLVLSDRGMKTTHYLRLLLSAHLAALREQNMLVTPKEEEDEDL